MAAAIAGLISVNPAAQASPDAPVHADVRRVLSSIFGFSDRDLRSLARGDVVVRALDVTDDREVSALGVIQVNVPAAFYADQLRDIASFKRHEAVQQIGMFRSPATNADLASLTLDREHIDELRSCSTQGCDVNLSAAAIADAGRAIAWDAADADRAAQRWYRDLLAGMVRDYQARGDAALMTYVDGSNSLSLSKEFTALVSSPPPLLAAFPSVRAHLDGYPRSRRAGVDDRLYWSKEQVGPHLVVSITHLTIVAMSDETAPVAYVAASRQIYGSRLYEASLGLTVLVRDPSNDARTYLVYANRSRVDAIGGWLGPIKRAIVRPRARAQMSPTLQRAKHEAERRYGRVAGSGG